MLRDVYRTATSRAAQRTIIYGTLLALGSAILYGVAVIGYIGFYRDYVPHRVRTAPLYLQYGTSPTSAVDTVDTVDTLHPVAPPPPFAIADLRRLGLKTSQDYDVSVSLTLPRSPANLAAGNFMLELALVSASSSVFSSTASDALARAARLPPADPREFLVADGRRVVFAAARSALLAYTDPLVATANHLLFLPYYLLAPAGTPETARIDVPMAESLSFADSDNPPAAVFVELRAAPQPATGTPYAAVVQTYAAEVVFAARLRGLRWLMFHHRVASFLILTSAFWVVEVLSMAGMAAIVGGVLLSRRSAVEDAVVKEEAKEEAESEEEDEEEEEGKAGPKSEEDDEGKPSVKRERAEGERSRPLGSIPAAPRGRGDDGSSDSHHTDEGDDEDEGAEAARVPAGRWTKVEATASGRTSGESENLRHRH